MVFSIRAFLIVGIMLCVFVAGVFLGCRSEGKSDHASVMETMGWSAAFVVYSIADYLLMTASLY